jgi:lysophospholipase L1-like esterase
MNTAKVVSLVIRIVVVLTISVIATSFFLANLKEETSPDALHVACVGDSLTQSTIYPLELSNKLGSKNYVVENFGVGSTTVSLDSETPYMDTSKFHDALEFQPDIVIIMMGTNDAQPSLHQYNTTFVDDYLTLVAEFQKLSTAPEIWIVLPPPIFSDQGGKISPDYFANVLIPLIEQVAAEANLPTIDVYSALLDRSDCFPDGIHPTTEGGKLIAKTIYDAIKPQ